MTIKYTNHYLHKLEDLMAETNYTLRYEKGNFKSGYCILNSDKVAVINKYFSKINCLVDIIKEIEVDQDKLSDKNKQLYHELSQTKLEL